MGSDHAGAHMRNHWKPPEYVFITLTVSVTLIALVALVMTTAHLWMVLTEGTRLLPATLALWLLYTAVTITGLKTLRESVQLQAG